MIQRLEFREYTRYGFAVEGCELDTGKADTVYRVRWLCCGTEDSVSHASALKRMRRSKAGQRLCWRCARHKNGVAAMARLRSPFKTTLDEFTPNVPKIPYFVDGMISAAAAWPVPPLLRATL